MSWWSARSTVTQVVLIVIAAAAIVAAIVIARVVSIVSEPSAVLREDTLIAADAWDPEPKMLAAGLGFTGIIGVPGLTLDDLEGSRTQVRLAGGAWNDVTCTAGGEPSLSSYTSAAAPEAIESLYGAPVYYSDGLPIEFSWPVLPSTLQPDDFAVTLNDGAVVTPLVAAVWPNFEYNERSTVVIFGYFGNRLPLSSAGAIYPTRVEVVESQTPLRLAGPQGEVVDAVGMAAETRGSPYTDPDVAPQDRGGPILAAAKITRYSSEGDAGPRLFSPGLLPNHGEALYGERAQYRLRVLTTGGMTPDGVRGMHPDEFERFFRVIAVDSSGTEIEITEAGVDYEIDGARLRVEGLADLGLRQDTYDECYSEDKDNQIDIILSGDEAAMRAITRVQMPSTGEYSPVYNPGGPGADPMPDVRYSAPSPPIDVEVYQGLDDPLQVTYP